MNCKTLESLDKGKELEVYQAATSTNLSNGYSALKDFLDFGENMTYCRLKEEIPFDAKYFSAAFGLGWDMQKKALWICGDAVLALQKNGYDDVVTQIADSFGLSYTHISNWTRTCERVAFEFRDKITPTVAMEIACSKYHKDSEKNKEICDKLLGDAIQNQWTCLDARSNVRELKNGEGIKKDKKSYADLLKENSDLMEKIKYLEEKDLNFSKMEDILHEIQIRCESLEQEIEILEKDAEYQAKEIEFLTCQLEKI